MPVPTTETAVDKTLEIRKLSDEIAVIKSNKERFENELKIIIGSADSATLRLNEIHDKIKENKDILNSSLKETTEFLAVCKGVMHTWMHEIESAKKLYEEIEKKISESNGSISRIEEAGLAIHTQTVEEMRKLLKHQKDLAIYRARLEEYFSIYLPNQKILLL